MSPGPISDSYPGPADDSPYVPSWCYPNGPRMCPCGHHEGYHNDAGECLLHGKCKCQGLPADAFTPLGEDEPASVKPGDLTATLERGR